MPAGCAGEASSGYDMLVHDSVALSKNTTRIFVFADDLQCQTFVAVFFRKYVVYSRMISIV